jgi:polyhydroxybutyrate depolymerase
MSFTIRLSALLCFLALSASLSSQTTKQDSIYSGGMWRAYILYVPAIYSPSKPAPLVLNIHGLGSNMSQQMFYGEFRPIADTAGFILVHPNGTVGSNGRGWNNFAAVGSGVNDIGFLSALIDTIRKKYPIDTNRIYSTGMSNGGFMTYDLGCFLNNRIAAIASVCGSMMPYHLSACNAVHPTPVMEIHGTADPLVSYTGQGGLAASEDIDSLVAYWVRFNHCGPIPVITQVPDINTSDNCNAELHVFSNGLKGSSVELYKILGGGHAWPDAPVNLSNGPTNRDVNASNVIWRFFSQYRLNSLSTGIAEYPATEYRVDVFPNPATESFQVNLQGFTAPVDLHLFNALGMEVTVIPHAVSGMRVQRGNLPAGLYLLKLVSQDKSINQVLLLQ